MRQLFLPVCLCLVTWSSATGSNPGMTLDEFSRESIAGKGQIASGRNIAMRHDETASAIIAIPGDAPLAHEDASTPDLADIAALVPNLAAEIPVPSGVVINNGEPAGLPLPPIPKPVVERSEDEVCRALTAAAQQNDVPAPFFIRLLFQESRFRPEIVSSAGAQGIAQFMPETATLMGLDNPYDPLEAIPASARLLSRLVRQFGNLGLAAAAYNAGPRRVADWLAAKGKTKLPDETQGYVKIITGKPIENWSAASARHPAQKLPVDAPCQEAAGLLAWSGPEELPLPTPAPRRESVKVADAKPVEKPVEKPASRAAKIAKNERGGDAKAKDENKEINDKPAAAKHTAPADSHRPASSVKDAVRKDPPKKPTPPRQKVAER